MNTVKKRVTTQFDLTNNILNNLSQFDITPTAKLVLLYLTSCYNPKHAEIFPKQKTIAIKLGISERSVTRAIQELFNEGLVLIECKYTNRYKFTSRIVSQQAEFLSDELRQNDTSKGDNLSRHDIEQKSKKIKNKDDEYLKLYALKRGVKNIPAYINAIKKNGGAEQIVNEYKSKQNAKKRALDSITETQSLIKKYENMKKDCIMPNQSIAWQELGKKIKALCKQS